MVAQKVFGQVWENSEKNPLHPQKFACSYTYGDIYNHFIHFFSVNREKNF